MTEWRGHLIPTVLITVVFSYVPYVVSYLYQPNTPGTQCKVRYMLELFCFLALKIFLSYPLVVIVAINNYQLLISNTADYNSHINSYNIIACFIIFIYCKYLCLTSLDFTQILLKPS